MFGQEYEYVKKVYHKCGICQQAMLFDLETLFNHLRGVPSMILLRLFKTLGPLSLQRVAHKPADPC